MSIDLLYNANRVRQSQGIVLLCLYYAYTMPILCLYVVSFLYSIRKISTTKKPILKWENLLVDCKMKLDT